MVGYLSVGSTVFVMSNAVLSQQFLSRERLTCPCGTERRAHLREQVQGSVAHGTGGVDHSQSA